MIRKLVQARTSGRSRTRVFLELGSLQAIVFFCPCRLYSHSPPLDRSGLKSRSRATVHVARCRKHASVGHIASHDPSPSFSSFDFLQRTRANMHGGSIVESDATVLDRRGVARGPFRDLAPDLRRNWKSQLRRPVGNKMPFQRNLPPTVM